MTISSNTHTVAKAVLNDLDLTLTTSGETNVLELLETVIKVTPGTPVTARTDDGHEVGVVQYVRDLAAEQPGYFQRKADTASTTPAPNPFSVATYSLTEQMRLHRQDPALAERLEREAAMADGRGDTSNPWSQAGLSITRQHALERDNPAEAARLRTAAGVTE